MRGENLDLVPFPRCPVCIAYSAWLVACRQVQSDGFKLGQWDIWPGKQSYGAGMVGSHSFDDERIAAFMISHDVHWRRGMSPDELTKAIHALGAHNIPFTNVEPMGTNPFPLAKPE